MVVLTARYIMVQSSMYFWNTEFLDGFQLTTLLLFEMMFAQGMLGHRLITMADEEETRKLWEMFQEEIFAPMH